MINLLKLLTASIVFMVTAIVFMFTTVSYLPRLGGANYYDHGCFDGVTNLLIQLEYSKLVDKEKIARERCNNATKKLKDKGYLF